MADRDGLPLPQDRARLGEPPPLEVGEPDEASDDGRSRLRFPAVPAGCFPGHLTTTTATGLLPPNRKTGPRNRSPVVPDSVSPQQAVVELSNHSPNSGM